MKTKLSCLRRLMTMLLCFVTISAMAQVTVRGVVSDPTGEPLIGASVVEKGKQNGTVTDIDGKFQIKVPNANATITVSYVGYLTQDIKLADAPPSTSLSRKTPNLSTKLSLWATDR